MKFYLNNVITVYLIITFVGKSHSDCPPDLTEIVKGICVLHGKTDFLIATLTNSVISRDKKEIWQGFTKKAYACNFERRKGFAYLPHKRK